MERFKIQNLTFTYPEQETPVLRNVSINLNSGDFAVLAGPSGCGKSTMLRQLKTVLAPHGKREGTILFNGTPLEAICFGLASAVMMGASIVWFNCCNTVFTSDKIIYLFGRVIPALSLMISMTLRFVPRFKNFLQSVLRTQQAMHKPENTKEKLGQALASFSATVSWAMEQSIVSADSMKSRGYGLFGRTAFSIYIFEKRDGITLFVLFLLCAGAAVPHIVGLMGWTYYPSMTGELIGPVQIFAYLCYGGMCNLPLIIDMMEDRKWNALRSKI